MLLLTLGATRSRSIPFDEAEPEIAPSPFLTLTAYLCLSFGTLVSLICPHLDALLSTRLPTVESQLFARHFGLSMLLIGTICIAINTGPGGAGNGNDAIRTVLIPVFIIWHATVAAAFVVELGWIGTYGRSSPPFTRLLAYGGAVAHVLVLCEGLAQQGYSLGGFGLTTHFLAIIGGICSAARHASTAVSGAASSSSAIRTDVAIVSGTTVACLLLAWWTVSKLTRGPSFIKCLTGELVVITGAAGGIGQELALAFGREGARLALWDVRAEALDQTVKWLESEGISSNQVRTAVVDVSDADAVTAAAEALQKAEGAAPKVVVSNAAVMRGTTLLGATDAEIRSDFATNALAAFWLSRSFLRQMLNEPSPRGVVVTIGSIMAELPAARQSEYCASKAALTQLHECLRWELKATPNAQHVRTSLIQPYAVETPMIAGAALLGEGDEACHRRFALIRRLLPPLKPALVAQRVAQAVQRGEERVYIPSVVGWVPVILNLLPTFVSDAILNAIGASDGMCGFRGCAPATLA